METVLRVAIIYITILVGLRVVGKREFSQLAPIELVALLMIPELVSQSLVRDDFSITNALIAISTLFSLIFLSSILQFKSKWVDKALEGAPTVLVQHGQYVVQNLSKERVTPGEIFNEMRKSGLDQLKQVKWAVLETDGKISIVAEDDQGQEKQHRAQESEIQ
jgi:uncharacterized membrane protein YcaP (DUF421 family)